MSNECMGPWNMLRQPEPYQATDLGIVVCRFAAPGGTQCTALSRASEAMLPTPCIKLKEPDAKVSGIYAARILEGTVIFDADNKLLLQSPNLEEGHEPVLLRKQANAARLVRLIQNVGRPISGAELLYGTSQTDMTPQQVSNHATVVAYRLNRFLGHRPTEQNPGGYLIQNTLKAGYSFRAPAK